MPSHKLLLIGALGAGVLLLGLPLGAQAGSHDRPSSNRPVVSAGPTGSDRGPHGGVTVTTGLPPGGSQGGPHGTSGGGIGQGSYRGNYNYPGGTVRDHRSH